MLAAGGGKKPNSKGKAAEDKAEVQQKRKRPAEAEVSAKKASGGSARDRSAEAQGTETVIKDSAGLECENIFVARFSCLLGDRRGRLWRSAVQWLNGRHGVHAGLSLWRLQHRLGARPGPPCKVLWVWMQEWKWRNLFRPEGPALVLLAANQWKQVKTRKERMCRPRRRTRKEHKKSCMTSQDALLEVCRQQSSRSLSLPLQLSRNSLIWSHQATPSPPAIATTFSSPVLAL